MTTTVNNTIATLLKEKGFEQNIEVGVTCRIKNLVNKSYEQVRPIRQQDLDNLWSEYNETYPTIAEVVMWLYEKHKVWVSPNPFIKRDSTVVWLYDIFLNDYIKDQLPPSQGVSNLTDAYLHGIEYTLNNLIWDTSRKDTEYFT